MPTVKDQLYSLGQERVRLFCELNLLPRPGIYAVPRRNWHVNACAYYRPDTERMRKWTQTGINICIQLCGHPCTDAQTPNWSRPGSVTDRTPYGVLAHELGHHVDWLTGERKWEYGSEYCESVMKESGEAAVTSYGNENPAEWFAECFRVFCLNPDLLSLLRPRAYGILCSRFKPIEGMDWRQALGENVPSKILRTLRNKGAK